MIQNERTKAQADAAYAWAYGEVSFEVGTFRKHGAFYYYRGPYAIPAYSEDPEDSYQMTEEAAWEMATRQNAAYRAYETTQCFVFNVLTKEIRWVECGFAEDGVQFPKVHYLHSVIGRREGANKGVDRWTRRPKKVRVCSQNAR